LPRPAAAASFGEEVLAAAVEAGVAPGVNAAEVVLAEAADVAIGDSAEISLGYEDGGPELVFTGEVTSVRHNLRGSVRVTATDGGAALARTRVARSYEGQAAGDVVGDLAGAAGASTGDVQSGPSLAFYALDESRSAWSHVAVLARASGFLAWIGSDGALSFCPPPPGPPAQSFAHGEDLLEIELGGEAPGAGAVTAVGEGAAGAKGADAWSWLVKDPGPVTASAGSGAPERRLQDGALRSADAASAAAEGAAAAAARGVVAGRAVVPGAPGVSVGATIVISGAPADPLNGTFVVSGLRHRFTPAGFTTTLLLAAAGGGGLGGLL
jgi:hypothetical protein